MLQLLPQFFSGLGYAAHRAQETGLQAVWRALEQWFSCFFSQNFTLRKSKLTEALVGIQYWVWRTLVRHTWIQAFEMSFSGLISGSVSRSLQLVCYNNMIKFVRKHSEWGARSATYALITWSTQNIKRLDLQILRTPNIQIQYSEGNKGSEFSEDNYRNLPDDLVNTQNS